MTKECDYCKYWVVLGISLLLIIGWKIPIGLLSAPLSDVPANDNPKQINSHYGTCHVDYYSILLVDELVPTNCYAFRNDFKKGDNEYQDYLSYQLNKSFQYAYEDEYGVYTNPDNIWYKEHPNEICDYVQDLNHGNDVYCLKNKTMCMIVEDNQICNLFELQ